MLRLGPPHLWFPFEKTKTSFVTGGRAVRTALATKSCSRATSTSSWWEPASAELVSRAGAFRPWQCGRGSKRVKTNGTILGVGAPTHFRLPILVVGLVDVHWGHDLDFDPWPADWFP